MNRTPFANTPWRSFAHLRALCVKASPAAVLTVALIPTAIAQSNDTKPTEPKASETRPSSPFAQEEAYDASRVLKTYYLTSVTQQNDANEILIAMRNVLSPRAKLYLVASQNAIVVDAIPEDQATSQKVIAALDRPHKAYRLTFTLADSDNGKRVGIQHFSIDVVSGQRTILKQGSKIPVITGTSKAGSESQNQFTYLDVGMNFDATLEATPGGLYLKSKVEQSSVADEHMSGELASEPIVRQTSLEGMSAITLGKPITLGSVDLTGTTRHVDIEVVAEPIS